MRKCSCFQRCDSGALRSDDEQGWLRVRSHDGGWRRKLQVQERLPKRTYPSWGASWSVVSRVAAAASAETRSDLWAANSVMDS